MTLEEFTAKLRALILSVIKATINKRVKWKSAKSAMLEKHPFTSTTAFENFVSYNTSSGKNVDYKASFFSDLGEGQYIFLVCLSTSEKDRQFEFYSYKDGDIKLSEYPVQSLQAELFRLYNAIVFGDTFDSAEFSLDNISL